MASTILVTGRTGQLAASLAQAAQANGVPVHCVGRPSLDFDRPASISEVLHQHAPSLVINTAAYTAVDTAEDDEPAAYRANRDGPAELARLCTTVGIPLIHISTDYVFDGRKGAPYVETDATSPESVYGASKLAGEQMVVRYCPGAVVVRTSWVYSPTGKNFIRTMLRAAERTSSVRVVADQIGCPTSAPDLADAVLRIAGRLLHEVGDHYAGIYHVAGSGDATWHELATATFAAAARHGRIVPVVEPIPTHAWPTKAVRPPDSRLDCGKLAAVFGLCLPAWRDSLTRTVDTILGQT